MKVRLIEKPRFWPYDVAGMSHCNDNWNLVAIIGAYGPRKWSYNAQSTIWISRPDVCEWHPAKRLAAGGKRRDGGLNRWYAQQIPGRESQHSFAYTDYDLK
jgi:hypothetical protein